MKYEELELLAIKSATSAEFRNEITADTSLKGAYKLGFVDGALSSNLETNITSPNFWQSVEANMKDNFPADLAEEVMRILRDCATIG